MTTCKYISPKIIWLPKFKSDLAKWAHRFKQSLKFQKFTILRVSHSKSIPTKTAHKLSILFLQSNLEGILNF
jgi:hypothetical protein